MSLRLMRIFTVAACVAISTWAMPAVAQDTPTATATVNTPTVTNTPTRTPTTIFTHTPTGTWTATPTKTGTKTRTPTNTPTETWTATPRSTATATAASTATMTGTPPTVTPTAIGTACAYTFDAYRRQHATVYQLQLSTTGVKTDLLVIASPGAGKRIYLTALELSATVATTATLEAGTATKIYEDTLAAGGVHQTAMPVCVTPGAGVYLTTTGAGVLSLNVQYVIE